MSAHPRRVPGSREQRRYRADMEGEHERALEADAGGAVTLAPERPSSRTPVIRIVSTATNRLSLSSS